MTGILGILEDIPALSLYISGIYIVVVVNDTHIAPEVGNRVGVVRVIGEVLDAFSQVCDVGDLGEIQLLEHTFTDQTLDHIIRGNQHIVGIAALELGVHHFVGIEVLHDNLDTEFLFEIRDQIFAHILAPVIELESVGTVLGYGIFGTAAVVAAAAGSGKQHGTSQHHGNQFFHAFVLLFSLIIGTTFTMISTTVISAMTRVDRALMDGFTRLLMV